MRSIYVFIFALIFVFAGSAEAQLVQKYKAKEGEGKARTTFEESYGDSDLMMVGAVSGEYEGVPIKLEFDMRTGEASAWMYMFHSSENDTNETYVVVKSIMGMQVIPVDVGNLGISLPFEPTESLDDVTWINSDELMDSIRTNRKFTDFMDVFPDVSWSMGALFMEPMQSKAVWAVIFKGDENHNLNCFVDAVTGETECMSSTDVEDVNISEELSVYPNPASDLAIVSIPVDYIDLNANIQVFDMRGNQLVSRSAFDINSSGQFAINVSNFASGVYNLLYTGNGKVFTAHFLVAR